jgi:CHRD domain-containing protein
MRTKHEWMISMAVLLTAVAACSDDDGGTGTDTEFEAQMSGADEVPAVNTIATGSATISIQGAQIVYQVDVQGIENVLFSHIHIAPEGENGPVRLNLCGTDDTPGCSTIDTGTLVSDSNGVTTGTPAITFDSLVSAIRAGNAYVNVHTTANPGGEIRGQITPQ